MSEIGICTILVLVSTGTMKLLSMSAFWWVTKVGQHGGPAFLDREGDRGCNIEIRALGGEGIKKCMHPNFIEPNTLKEQIQSLHLPFLNHLVE